MGGLEGRVEHDGNAEQVQPVAPVDVLPAVGPERLVVAPHPVGGLAGDRHVAGPVAPGLAGGHPVGVVAEAHVGDAPVRDRVGGVREDVAVEPDRARPGRPAWASTCPLTKSRPGLEVVVAPDEHSPPGGLEPGVEGRRPAPVLREGDGAHVDRRRSRGQERRAAVDVAVDHDDDLEVTSVLGLEARQEHVEPGAAARLGTTTEAAGLTAPAPSTPPSDRSCAFTVSLRGWPGDPPGYR